MRDYCAVYIQFISHSCVNYVILTLYVRRKHNIKVIQRWYMHEMSLRHTWNV